MEDNEIMNAEEIEVTEDGEVVETEVMDEQQKSSGGGIYVLLGSAVTLGLTLGYKYVVKPGFIKLRKWTKATIADAKEKKASKAAAKEKKDSEEPKEKD